MTHTGIIFAAPKSGSGKTTITCAMLQAMKNRKYHVRAFKSGPDYIDPMFHRDVIGVPSRNLDTFFSEGEQIRSLFALEQEKYAYSVIEGAMGLYDGLGGIQEKGSAYHLAQTLNLPIVLILDAHGMGRTMVPVLTGLMQYDRDQRIIGVILNRTTDSFCHTMAPIIEKELGLPVFGCFPSQKELHLESRHLGLMMPDELCFQVKNAAKVLEEHVDIDGILGCAKNYIENTVEQSSVEQSTEKRYTLETSGKTVKDLSKSVQIAVAYDRAFCFYYEDNLRLLRNMGAKTVFFSPLNDKMLPEGTDAILLGGGYPELYAGQLSENRAMRESILRAVRADMPSVAECGGFMYLHETMTDTEGNTFPMVGAVKGGCRNSGKLTRFGYVELHEKEPHFLEGNTIRGHEFHYYDSENNGADCVAVKPVSGKSYDCIHSGENYWWGYPHLYYPSNPEFAGHFVEEAKAYHNKKKNGVCNER